MRPRTIHKHQSTRRDSIGPSRFILFLFRSRLSQATTFSVTLETWHRQGLPVLEVKANERNEMTAELLPIVYRHFTGELIDA